jgi:hypothetical protein
VDDEERRGERKVRDCKTLGEVNDEAPDMDIMIFPSSLSLVTALFFVT